VAAAGWFKYTRLACFSKPNCDRQLYRLIKRHQITRIVEVGIASMDRTISMIEVAQRYAGDTKVIYSGLDWFDARPPQEPQLLLKQAHASFASIGAQVRLVPGDPARSLTAIANSHPNTQLLLIACTVAEASLDATWFYVPRMLRPDSLVLRQQPDVNGVPSLVQLKIVELADRADRAAARRAA
jgi:hypothetical protein